MIWFIIGLLLGLFNGMFIMALLTISSRSDEKIERGEINVKNKR